VYNAYEIHIASKLRIHHTTITQGLPKTAEALAKEMLKYKKTSTLISSIPKSNILKT
jgi:hypothetical protein